MKRFVKQVFANSFFIYLTMELAEEMLESLIALGISYLWVKAMSAILGVVLTQSLKLPIKKFIKWITYREGNDKMNFIKKVLNWVIANKKSLVGTVCAFATSVATAYATYGGLFEFLPKLMIGGFDFMSVIVGVGLFVLAELGVTGKGFESIAEFLKRSQEEKVKKAERAIIHQAKAEIRHEQKQANQTQAQLEKARAKEQLDAQIKAEKERIEAERKARVEIAKQEILSQNQNRQ